MAYLWRERVSDFLHGGREVAKYYLNDPTKKEGDPAKRIMSEERITINEVKGIQELRDETDGKFTKYYVTTEQQSIF